MHLLAAEPGSIADGSAAVDLGQTPGDIVALLSADTDIALLAAAQAGRRATDPAAPSLRLAPVMRLGHNFSVDLYMARVAQARLVVARLLGGSAYWPYGVERLVATCREHAVPLALLPGDDKPDPELARLSSLPEAACRRLWRYLAEGGPGNAENFLRYAAALLDRAAPHPSPLPASGERERGGVREAPRPAGGEREGPAAKRWEGEGNAQWAEPAPLLRAGLYWPGRAVPSLADIAALWEGEGAIVPIVFYRALVQSGNAAPVDALARALLARRLRPLPVFVHSLKEAEAAALLAALFAAHPPAVILNATGFSLAASGGSDPLDADCPVLQIVFSGGEEAAWREGTRGLGPRDLAMNVALPEIDGRILARAVSFKEPLGRDPETEADLVGYRPLADRVHFVADLAGNWARLRQKPPAERRVAIVLANYPNRDGRIGNGVGLDTPQSAAAILGALRGAGYRTGEMPLDATLLMGRLLAGPTNARPRAPAEESLSFADYSAFFGRLPRPVQRRVLERWGAPERDPFYRPGRVDCGSFAIPGLWSGNVAVLVQPARGYNFDPQGSYHDPALVPPHSYFAAYAWLADAVQADAVIDLGKHGTLEWLPGKALALSAECFPEAVLGPLPHLYPFIVNDPGEGSQAKRRTQAVIIDHLTPPLTRAGSYGPQAELERLIDEYYEAAQGDPRRVAPLAAEILERARAAGIDRDCGIASDETTPEALQKLDGFLCELKELQIRDGLHVLGTSPEGARLDALLVAIARARRGSGADDESLLRALAADLALGADPMLLDLAQPWTGPRPQALAAAPPPCPPPLAGQGSSRSTAGSPPPPQAGEGWGGGREDDRGGGWRTAGDTVERLEALALLLVSGAAAPAAEWHATRAVLGWIERVLRPAVAACGAAEIAALLAGLDGSRVAPGPSGAPSRGRPEVLPTGRNFYSLDTRAVPTPAAWQLGWHSAGLLVERHAQEHGNYPRRLALSAWGTANMRTGGDDIAQALALIGARPTWEGASGRVTGFEVLPASILDRPRVDVTLRISGFFRDAFPGLIDLFDSAVGAVAALDEPPEVNPLAARVAADRQALEAEGAAPADAARRARYRIFGSQPGAYGAGLQTLIDERIWDDEADLAEAYIGWSRWAYGAGSEGEAERGLLEARLAGIDAIVHNQDNREHDLLDSDDYYQFEGGLALAVRHLSGRAPAVYHNDHSQPDRPRIRTLREELGRIVRGRAANPRWIAGVMRHGYKGAAEIAATVDYLFAFAATARAVEDAHFDLLYDAYLGDEAVRDFMAAHNPAALAETHARFREAIERGLWRPTRNSIRDQLLSVIPAKAGTQEAEIGPVALDPRLRGTFA
ncbi:MAG TPA: cobaltochelatase subunit CobN [Stellaceae bacterium]|nr:cobaltochelatase subunit CobN [Stellaceae bacterium]